ncbi:MAG: hypothetical protein PUP93_32550 [Rhizonema sp. NSF051]|nr:hypothetical protein [Rhizonema sp. NSF051]
MPVVPVPLDRCRCIFKQIPAALQAGNANLDKGDRQASSVSDVVPRIEECERDLWGWTVDCYRSGTTFRFCLARSRSEPLGLAGWIEQFRRQRQGYRLKSYREFPRILLEKVNLEMRKRI